MAKKLELNEALMSTAIIWAQLSYCKRSKVGAVLSRDGRIVAAGFNGTLPGAANECEDENGDSKITVLHAEANAMAHCLQNGIKTKGTVLHITLSPCLVCAKQLIYAGITEVYYMEAYRITDGIDLLKEHGVIVRQFNSGLLDKLTE